MKKISPIKITFISLFGYHPFNPRNFSKFGGAEVQAHLLATELAKDSNYEVSYILGNFGQPNIEIIQNVKLYKFYAPEKRFRIFRMLFGAMKLCYLINKISPDLCIQMSAGLET